jgi:WD40 repeat protein
MTFTIQTGFNQRIDSLSMSADDRWLAVAGKDGKIRVWSLEQPNKKPIELCCHNKAVTTVLFHPTNKQILASGGVDKRVYLWDISRPDKAVRDYNGHDHTIQSLAFSQDGQWLAAGTQFSYVASSIKTMIAQRSEDLEFNKAGGTIWIRNITKPDASPNILKSGDAISLTTLAFNPGNNLIAANGANDDIVLWQWKEANKPPMRLPGHNAQVRLLRYNDSGTLLISLDDESAIRLWDLRKPTAQPHIFEGHGDAVTGVDFDHTSQWVASVGGWDRTAYLWDLTSPQSKKIEVENAGDFMTLAFHPKKAILAIGSGSTLLDVDNTVRLWNLPNIEQPDKTLKGFTSELTALAISRNGAWLAAAARYDKEVRLWKFDELKQPPYVVPTEHDVTALAFLQDGVLLIATSDEKVRLLSDVNTKSTHLLIGHQGSRVNTMAYDPHQHLLATGSEDGIYRLWEITAFDQPAALQRSLKYQTIYSVAFGPEGKEVAAAGKDGKVRVWNLDRDNADAQLLDGPGKNIYSVVFSPDGNWVAAGGSDKTVKLWPRTKWLAKIVCQQVTRNLTYKEWAEYVGADVDYEKTCDNLPAGGKL